MRAKLMMVPVVVLAVTAVLGSTAMADSGAATPRVANTTVTIQAQGTDLSGTVSSPDPARCANNRTVILMKQVGPRGGGDDVRIASDTASRQGNTYRWDTGNTGIQGRFYAKVRPIPGCRGDTSPTIRAIRNP